MAFAPAFGPDIFNNLDTAVNTLGALLRDILLTPTSARLTDQSEICVKIPASMLGISNTVCIIPVTAPAKSPAIPAVSKASIGFILYLTIIRTHIQPPNAKLPSTVRSAILRSLKVINTPSTIIAHNTACPVAPSMDGNKPDKNSTNIKECLLNIYLTLSLSLSLLTFNTIPEHRLKVFAKIVNEFR